MESMARAMGEKKKEKKGRDDGKWEMKKSKIEALRQPATASYVVRQEDWLIKSAGTIQTIDYGHGPPGRPYGILSSSWN
jgi:hypothetical protein